MNETWKEILQLTQKHCVNGVELDASDLARLSGTLRMKDILEQLPFLEAEDLLELIEIDLCCGADYIVTGITQKGKEAIL